MTTIERQRFINHLVLLYRPGDADAACRLLQLLGCEIQNMGAHRQTTQEWFTVKIDATSTMTENVAYLLPAAPDQLALDDAIARTLGTRSASDGGSAGSPASEYRAYSELVANDPERTFHFGIRFSSFDALEACALAAARAGQEEPGIEGRASICMQFRPLAGTDAAMDARVDASPLFTPETRPSLGKRGVQVYVRTDLFAPGSLAMDHVIELQFEFPTDDERLTGNRDSFG